MMKPVSVSSNFVGTNFGFILLCFFYDETKFCFHLIFFLVYLTWLGSRRVSFHHWSLCWWLGSRRVWFHHWSLCWWNDNMWKMMRFHLVLVKPVLVSSFFLFGFNIFSYFVEYWSIKFIFGGGGAVVVLLVVVGGGIASGLWLILN